MTVKTCPVHGWVISEAVGCLVCKPRGVGEVQSGTLAAPMAVTTAAEAADERRNAVSNLESAHPAEPVGAAQAEARRWITIQDAVDLEAFANVVERNAIPRTRELVAAENLRELARRLRAALSVQPAEPPEDGVAPWSADDVLRRALEETVRVLRQCGLIRECAVHFAALATAKPGASEGRDQPETPSGATPKAGAAEQKAAGKRNA